MIDIYFEINGRRVRPDQMGNELEATMLASVSESIVKAVGSVRCKEHGQRPRVKVKGKDLKHLKFEVSGCCDAVIKQVSAKLE